MMEVVDNHLSKIEAQNDGELSDVASKVSIYVIVSTGTGAIF